MRSLMPSSSRNSDRPFGRRRGVVVLLLLCLAEWSSLAAGADQEPPDPARQVNLAVNPGFEFAGAGDQAAQGWLPTGEDQLADWEKASYVTIRRGTFVPPTQDEGAARTGHRGLRLFGADLTACAVWQRIDLLQTEPKPILFAVWSRIDGTQPLPERSNATDRTVWAEFGIAVVRHMDGTKAEIDRARPAIDLSRGAGEWTFGQAVYVPEKPVRYIEVKVDLHSAGPATVLCVDDLTVAEADSTVAELEGRGLNVPAADILVARDRALPGPARWRVPLIDDSGRGRPRGEPVPLTIVARRDGLAIGTDFTPADGELLELLIAPCERKPLDSSHAADFYRFQFSADGRSMFSWALTRNERALGAPEDAAFFLDRQPLPPPSVSAAKPDSGPAWSFFIPFDSIQEAPPQDATWRLNVCLRQGERVACSSPTYARERKFGRLIFPAPAQEPAPSAIERVRVLSAHPHRDATPPYALRNSLPWGDVQVDVTLSWRGADAAEASLLCGTGAGEATRLPITLERGRHSHRLDVPLRQAGLRRLSVRVEADDGQVLAELAMPVTVSPLLTLWTYEPFLYADEPVAHVRAWLGAADPALAVKLRAHVEDWLGRRVGDDIVVAARADGPVRLDVPVGGVRVNAEPSADHWIVVEALDGEGGALGESRCRIGRIARPGPRKAEPIESVSVNQRGYLEVNGKPFFAVIASLNVKDGGRGYRKTPRLGFNAAKVNCGRDDKVIIHEDVSIRKLYTDLYQGGVYAAPCIWIPAADEERKALIDWFKEGPGFLVVIGGEVYRGTAHHFDRPEWLVYPERPVVVEYHNSGSWLDQVHDGAPVAPISMFPFPYWDWSPARKLVADYARERAVRAQTGLFTSLIVRQDPHSGIWDTRAFAYLSVIHGSTGAYLYVVATSGDPEDDRILEWTRGLVEELRLMGPIFTAEDQRRTVRVTPPAAGLQVGERRVGQERYVIVVNTSPEPVAARFELADGERARKVALRFEPPGEIETEDGRAFEDTLPGHWARLYRLELMQ